ncbi:hypothetical protein HOLleu_09094 [Holothuria leucospilota]|uniref:Uncharacterized protein n=1 Tax=Holothuria leucospilota TaxID=206669 RepID=A0A9Q1CJQ5_HOLLE|nr:hypothetical protein HOLleu_09094 [Holothuria leucospilota]
MGSYDGAECCELVVAYLLSQLEPLYGNSIGLYRDDGLAVFNEPPRKIEQIKKNICDIFKKNGLLITIEANKRVVNFLDVTLEFQRGAYKPYLKPGNTPLYVNAKSNHPRTSHEQSLKALTTDFLASHPTRMNSRNPSNNTRTH